MKTTPAPTRRTRNRLRKALASDDKALTLLERAHRAPDLKSMLRYTARVPDCVWRGLACVPPGSPLEELILAYQRYTSIPLEIPLFALLHTTGTWLACKRVEVVLPDGKRCFTDNFTVILAPSASCKTAATEATMSVCRKAGMEITTAPMPNSSAALLDMLQEAQGKDEDSIAYLNLFIDEFGAWWQTLQPGGVHDKTKAYLLNAYGNKEVSGATLTRGATIITKPILPMLGLSVDDLIHSQLAEEDWVSGMAQRVGWVVAHADPARPLRWNITIPEDELAKSFAAVLSATPIHSEYVIPEQVGSYVEKLFLMLAEADPLSVSFIRRVCYRMYKYAAIYHVLAGKPAPILDAQDMSYATRACLLHLHDLRYLIRTAEMVQYKELIAKAREIIREYQDKGETVTYRHLLMRMRSKLRNKDEAQALLELSATEPLTAGVLAANVTRSLGLAQ